MEIKLKNNNNNVNKKFFSFDIGLAILRPILSFSVVLTHCSKWYEHKPKLFYERIFYDIIFLALHVKIFFIISFFFSYRTFISNDYKKKLNRLLRLTIPYFIWPIFFLTLDNNKAKIKLELLKEQLLFGTAYILSYWFQWNLIVITVIFMLITFLFKKCCGYNFIFIIITIASFIYQYNGKYKKIKVYSCQRFFEVIPFASLGFIISSSDIISFLKKYRIKTILVCVYLLYFLIHYNHNIFVFKLNYGINNYFICISIFILFTMFPSERIKNKKVIEFIKVICNYTPGIYYIHRSMIKYIEPFSASVKNRTIKGSIITYLICYNISFIGKQFLGKTFLRSLFE